MQNGRRRSRAGSAGMRAKCRSREVSHACWSQFANDDEVHKARRFHCRHRGTRASAVRIPHTRNFLLNEAAIADLLEAQRASVLVIPSESVDAAIWQKAKTVAARVGSLQKILVMGDSHGLADRFVHFDEAIAASRNSLAFEPSIDLDLVCALFHTGGTTGRPKLVRLTHGNQVHAAWSFAQVHGIDEHDVALNGFPLFHVGGTMTVGLSVLAAGGHVVIPSPYSLRSPEAIRDYRPRTMSAPSGWR